MECRKNTIFRSCAASFCHLQYVVYTAKRVIGNTTELFSPKFRIFIYTSSTVFDGSPSPQGEGRTLWGDKDVAPYELCFSPLSKGGTRRAGVCSFATFRQLFHGLRRAGAMGSSFPTRLPLTKALSSATGGRASSSIAPYKPHKLKLSIL